MCQEECRKVAGQFVNIGNEFLTTRSQSKIPELSRMPNVLNSEKAFASYLACVSTN